MIDKIKVESIVNEQLNPETEFAVQISVSASNHITVVIDSDQGVTIDRCVAISRAIEQSFDREEEDFELEVASAGLSESLKVPRQFKKNVGRSLDVILSSGLKQRGTLLEATEQGITLEVEEMVKEEGMKRKKKVTSQQTYTYSDIKSALIVISFR